jgi:hypothetical protein
MERANQEKRNRSRSKVERAQEIRVTFESSPGVVSVAPSEIVDISEWGCGIRTKTLLKMNALVTVCGHMVDERRESRVRARVAWLRVTGPGTFMAGLAFEESLNRASSKPENAPPPLGAAEHDYYELLQLSPSADSDTVQRVYRILAQRFHPDNQETGSDEMFRMISEAHAVLSDPKKRAAYDVAHQALRSQRWKIFDKPEAAVGVESERRKRQGILSLLYVQRIQMTAQPWLNIKDLEDLLGCPREHLEFSLWYLKEQNWVKRSDNGRYTITAAGVDEAERSSQILIEPKRLITDGSAQSPAA